MLHLLFPRLTDAADRGAELFGWATRHARQPHWYVQGEVPDTIEGRFAVLTTIVALVLVRLESEPDQELAVALTERFVETMEAEHREMGIGDPRLGRTVRKLVGALSRKADLWRDAVGGAEWDRAVQESLSSTAPTGEAVFHNADRLRELWNRLEAASLQALAEGEVP